ncbi:F-box/kelch-repeat protein At3g23880-like [Trifolium pratense]|uniref:F-box/kelch-repeat protein At3g23880-like n=1 Tax=Trifolium pratense TaxID=57577 RepID=UPI001E692D66|nr:F-box/kelch-repeat protein At3g23880-like [Trifolium pratense]
MAAPTNEKKVSYIHDDIAFSILSKLPVKSLKRFSSVCKSWINLFENPIFINMFRNNLLFTLYADDNDVYLILDQLFELYDWKFYLLYGEDKFQNKQKLDLPDYVDFIREAYDVEAISILGSGINGILCIYDHDTHTEVVLWNPATRGYMKVPYSVPDFQDEDSTDISLHGFGYDHVRDDYKIIEHVGYNASCRTPSHVVFDPFWEIYSLESNSWRKINYDMPIRARATSDVYLNGVCHWWRETNNETCLVSFNLCNEVCLTTPSPLPDVPPDGFGVHLTVLNGSLALISNRKNTASYQISILGEFGVKESWIRLFDVQLASCIEQPIGAGMKGNIFFRKKDDQLACFDLTTGLIEDIGLQGTDYACQVVHYRITLPSIGEINV